MEYWHRKHKSSGCTLFVFGILQYLYTSITKKLIIVPQQEAFFHGQYSVSRKEITMKNLYNNLKIRTKMLFGFSVVAVIMLLMIMYTFTSLSGIINSHENLQEGHFLRRDARFEYRYAFEVMKRHTNAMLRCAGIGDTATIQISAMQAYDALQLALSSLEAYNNLVLADDSIPSDEQQLRLATSGNVAQLLVDYHERVIQAVLQYALTGDIVGGIQVILDGQALENHLYAVNQFLDSISDTWIAGIEANMRNTESRTYSTIIVVLILVTLVTIGITILTTSAISKPVVLVADTLKDITHGEGDLTVVINTKSRDEIGRMARYFNQTLEKIRELVVEVKEDAAMLSSVGNDLASNMNTTATAVNKITSNVQDIRGRIVNQRSSISQTHSTMYKLVENIDTLDGHIEKMSDNVSSASTAIEEMAASIRSVADTLNKNTENVKALMEASEVGRTGINEVVGNIQEIARESAGLLEINAVMENIASQTNLLSMNAAIEAAHAGEAGRGFAVVASEIRKLAENSSKQSSTISAVLKKIKGSIDKITSSTSSVLDKFEDIDKGVKVVAQQEDNILHAMEEQEEGSRLIVDGVIEVSKITYEVRTGSSKMQKRAKEVIQESEALEKVTKEINSSIKEMAGEADLINNAVNYVKDVSGKNSRAIEQLSKGVSRFKV